MAVNSQVLTVAQIVAAEDALIANGVSVDALMQRAGQGAAEWVWRIAAGAPVTILCGPGNNGGDGYVIAEVLRGRGLDAQVVAPFEPKSDAGGHAAAAWRGETIKYADGRPGGIFVDCLFGSGLSRPLSDEHSELIAMLHNSHDFSIAVDLPSGVASDSGALLSDVPQYDLTLALGAWKFAHWRMPAMTRMGARRLVSIGVEEQDNAAQLIERPSLSTPARDTHKYMRGLLAIIGGAMPGAALLAAEAAMRSGAGYVKLFAPRSHPAASAGLVIDDAPLDAALEDKRINALLVGPGLGRDKQAQKRLSVALKRDVPTVLDGDALAMLASDAPMDRATLVVATPHEEELATLCKTFAIAGDDKLDQARALAEKSGMTVIAKGPDTFVCAPDGQTAVMSDAPSWLSVAGSGDCLAGIVASRLATGRSSFVAACQGVWLHCEAARVAGPALTADRLARGAGAAYAACL